MPLTDDLQKIAKSHGQHTYMHQFQTASEDAVPGWFFCDKHNDAGKTGADGGLNGVQPQSVHIIGIDIHNGDLNGEGQRATDGQQVSGVDF